MKTILCLLASLCVSLSAAAQFVNFADNGTPVSLEGFLQKDGLPTNYITGTNPASLANDNSVNLEGTLDGLTVWLDIYDDGYASGGGLVAQAAIGISNYTGGSVVFAANTLRLGVNGLYALGSAQLTSEFTFTYVNDGTRIIVDTPTSDGVLLVSHYDASTGSFYFTNPAPLTIANSSIVVINGRFNTTGSVVTAPEITSAPNASGTYGGNFSYTITADNTPTSYSLESGTLPGGVALNTATGVISGTPTETGSFNVTVGATNTAGTDTKAVAIAIARKVLTVSGLGASDKVYNGGAGAIITGTGTLVGVETGDTVTLTGTPTGAFADADAGSNKTVTISGLSLDGASAANYTLPAPTVSADIWTATLTVTGFSASDKVYDGTTTATITGTGTLVGVVGGDTVTLNGTASGAFVSATVGTAKTVAISGLSLGGGGASNYDLATPTATANITAAIVAPIVTVNSKSYDGTSAAIIASRSLTGVFANDVGHVALSGGTAVFSDPAVGAAKTVAITGLSLNGSAAGNYQLSSTSATTTADIAGIASVIALSDLIQIYDGTAKAVTVTTNPADLSTRVTYNGGVTPPIGAGTYAVVATVTADGYSGSATDTLIVAKAAPVISWPQPTAITAGTPLSSTQLNATANVPGTFVYTPVAGTVLTEGADQTLSCTFTPADTDNYTIVFGTTTITINELRVAPKITSRDRTTFTTGIECAFTITTTAQPAPTFSASGLPAWATLDATTGVLSGNPPTTAGAPFTVILTASNGAGPEATQNFTLNVETPPTASSTWVVKTLAGQAPTPGSADGTGAAARFHSPLGVAVDSVGNFYIADADNHVVRKVTFAGAVITIAGQAGVSGSADGLGAAASFNAPSGIAMDNSGNLYVADTLNHTIRKITSAGAVTTLAGQAAAAGSADGNGVNARFFGPEGVAFDGMGHLYVADTRNHTVRKIDLATNEVSTVAGRAGEIGSADGPVSVARLHHPSGIALGSSGRAYITDSGNNAIRELEFTSGGVVTTIAGLAGSTGAADGAGADARFNNPGGLATEGGRATLYVVDTDNHSIRQVNLITGAVSTVAGSAGTFGSADGTAATARFDFPSAIAWWNNGSTIGVADTANHTVRIADSGAPVTIVTQPQSQTPREGTNVSLTVIATGQPSPSYQWYLNGEAIPGATSDTYNVSNVERLRHAGAYTVVVSNAFGSVTSNTATLTVADAASLSTGGAAPSGWFYLALAALVAARGWTIRMRAAKARFT